jgi:hypothetical protein
MLYDGISSRLYCGPKPQAFRLNSITYFGHAIAEMLCRVNKTQVRLAMNATIIQKVTIHVMYV